MTGILCGLTLYAAASAKFAAAFAPSYQPRLAIRGNVRGIVTDASKPTTSLDETDSSGDDWAVIRPENADEKWDLSLGGVALAMDSAIKVSGRVKGGSSAEATSLLRYEKLTEASNDDVQSVMGSVGASLVCSGLGQELYKDPGRTTVAEVTYGPSDAVRQALSSVPNSDALADANALVFNFLGGEDLIVDEVLGAIDNLVEGLSISESKARVSFNSVSHKDIPDGTASVTVMATGGPAEGGFTDGLGKAVANGEAYFYQGKWYAVLEEDLNSEQ